MNDCCNCDLTSVICCPDILHSANLLLTCLLCVLTVAVISVQDGAEKSRQLIN